MTSIEDKLRELGIDPAWVLCGEIEGLKCVQFDGVCPVYEPSIACHGSIIARLIDMVEEMRSCVSCKYCSTLGDVEPCLSCDVDACSNWRYWEST